MMKNLFREAFQCKETQCTIIADKERAIQTAIQSIKRNRKELEEYTRANPKFLYTLEPISVPIGPLVAKLMAEAAEKANVGPMAAVAGVLADLAVKDMIRDGCEVAVVENGGEVSAVSNKPIDVALAAGDDPLSKRFGFRLTDFPTGVATSSGRFSHALSFGDAEAATIFCRDAGLADAAATAVGNVVKGEEFQAAIQQGINKALSIQGVEGVLIIYKGFVGTAGKVPQIIKVDSLEK
ncbi:UPF0280 family protein, partial [Candidatus Bathyarchaeota archaeon]|nr:UPF0280 family protein [Candidatus Bathyarchaeota archaeon]